MAIPSWSSVEYTSVGRKIKKIIDQYPGDKSDFYITSSHRSHTPASHHGGRLSYGGSKTSAVDVGFDYPNNKHKARKLADWLMSLRSDVVELIFSPDHYVKNTRKTSPYAVSAHYNHVHVAMSSEQADRILRKIGTEDNNDNSDDNRNEGAAPAVFSSFWDAQTADGKGMREETIASSYLPMGSRVRVTINGKSEVGEIQDLGPADFVYDRHKGTAVLDLNEHMMERLTGKASNLVEGTWELLSVGSGKTLYGRNLAGHPGGKASEVPWVNGGGDLLDEGEQVWYSSYGDELLEAGQTEYVYWDAAVKGRNPYVSFCFKNQAFIGCLHLRWSGNGRLRVRFVKDDYNGDRVYSGPWTVVDHEEATVPLADVCYDDEKARIQVEAMDEDATLHYCKCQTFQGAR